MSHRIDTLESNYRKYAEAYGKAVERSDAKATNKNFDKLSAIRLKLKACRQQGKAVLCRLMKDRSDAIATCAAADSLPFAEAEALKVLDAIGKKTGLIAFDAEMTAEQWRAGELEIREIRG
jgi:hypothetical protein